MLQCSDVNITKVRPLQLSGHYSCWLKPSVSKISACYVSVAHITHIPINIALWFPGVKGNKTFIPFFSELFTCFAIPLNVTHLYVFLIKKRTEKCENMQLTDKYQDAKLKAWISSPLQTSRLMCWCTVNTLPCTTTKQHLCVDILR